MKPELVEIEGKQLLKLGRLSIFTFDASDYKVLKQYTTIHPFTFFAGRSLTIAVNPIGTRNSGIFDVLVHPETPQKWIDKWYLKAQPFLVNEDEQA